MVLPNTREIKAGGTAPKCLAFIFPYSRGNCWPGEVNGELLGLVLGWGGCFCGCCLQKGPRLKGARGTAPALWSSRTDRAGALTCLGVSGDFPKQLGSLMHFMAVGGTFLPLAAVERSVTILIWASLTYISNSFSVVFCACVCLLVDVLFREVFLLVVFCFFPNLIALRCHVCRSLLLRRLNTTSWWQGAFLRVDKPSPRTDERFGSLGLLNPETNQTNCRKGTGHGREDAQQNGLSKTLAFLFSPKVISAPYSLVLPGKARLKLLCSARGMVW